MLIDTHAHLNFKAFRKNLDNVLWEAREKGIEKIIVPGTDLETSKKAVDLACHYENIYAAVGIHPHHVDKVKNQKLKVKNELKKLAKSNKVVAIGECGLDYYQYRKTIYKNYKVDKKFKETQKELFNLQIELAQELRLPLIIHNRQASEDIKKIINYQLRVTNFRGVFHCFSADKNFLIWTLEKGFYVGFDGNITYEKDLVKLVKATPLERIILETDSPFLLPEPLRSEKIFPNRPENVKIIAEWIALTKGDSFLKIAKKTTKNAKKLFRFLNG